ncbi:hypothetical protein SB766_24165, partial [Pseudomonas sp. SIMBA_077]
MVANPTAAALERRFLADFAACFFTRGLGHGLEALAFAGAHALAGVVLGLAVVLPFAGVDAVA